MCLIIIISSFKTKTHNLTKILQILGYCNPATVFKMSHYKQFQVLNWIQTILYRFP